MNGRRLLMVALLVVHGAVGVLVTRDRVPIAALPQLSIAVTNFSLPSVQELPIEPKMARIEASIDLPVLDPATNDDKAVALAQSMAPGGAGCVLTENVQANLRADSSVRQALALIPASARSVSNALLLWDGQWIDASAVGGPAALDPIRVAVAATVRAASADCRKAAVTGPRLLFVDTGSQTQILAFGSGQWTWDQLIDG